MELVLPSPGAHRSENLPNNLRLGINKILDTTVYRVLSHNVRCVCTSKRGLQRCLHSRRWSSSHRKLLLSLARYSFILAKVDEVCTSLRLRRFRC